MRLQQWIGGVALVVVLVTAQAEPVPRIVLVQPSGAAIPANLLRLSVTFAAPVEGQVLNRLGLRRANGMWIQQPFLEQELWSPSSRILTVMLHPGRVKSGLNAHDREGPILSPGDEVLLTLDELPIARWHVIPADVSGPTHSAWQVRPGRLDTRQPLVVHLDAPIDGRAVDHLAIADNGNRRVAGRARLTHGEQTWTFIPNLPWQAGEFKVVVRGTMEDSAGNRLNGHFENPCDAAATPPADVVIPFEVCSSLRQAAPCDRTARPLTTVQGIGRTHGR